MCFSVLFLRLCVFAGARGGNSFVGLIIDAGALLGSNFAALGAAAGTAVVEDTGQRRSSSPQ